MSPRRRLLDVRCLLVALSLVMGCAFEDGDDQSRDELLKSVSGPAEYVEVRPYGESVVAERMSPVQVSGCHSGGDTEGRLLAYSEESGETRTRSIAFNDYDAELATLLELSSDPSELDIDVEGAFDLDPAGTVISSEDPGLLATTQMLPPNNFGVFYRQTLEVNRMADLVAITQTGDEYPLGDLALIDWDFIGGLGIASECPPSPPPPASMRSDG